MTRGQIKTLWRRQVRDTAEIEWDDLEANDIINLAYAQVQTEIVKWNREAHVFWDYMPTTANIQWYPLPATFGIKRIGLKRRAADTSWQRLVPKGHNKLDDYVTPPGGQLIATTSGYYATEGQFFGIYPTPEESVADGVELIHSPIMALADDTEVPRIKLPLHRAIVYEAKLIALGDTDEASQETERRLAAIYASLPLWYEVHHENDDKLTIVGVANRANARLITGNDVEP